LIFLSGLCPWQFTCCLARGRFLCICVWISFVWYFLA